MKHFDLTRFAALFALGLALLTAPRAASAPTGLSTVIFTNLNLATFDVDLSAAPTNMVKVRAGAGAAAFTNVVWVAKNGNDGTGVRADLSKPFLTITAALTAALAGDLVFVWPGTYAESLLLKNGVNLYFTDGAVVAWSDAGVNPLVFDGGASVTCIVDGYGVFSRQGSTDSGADALQLTGANSSVVWRCRYIETTSDAARGGRFNCASVVFYGDVFAGGAGVQVSNAAGLYEIYGNIVATNDYGLWNSNGSVKFSGTILAKGNSAIAPAGASSVTEVWNTYAKSERLYGWEDEGGTSAKVRNSVLESTRAVNGEGNAISKYAGGAMTLDNVQLIAGAGNTYSIDNQGVGSHGSISILSPSYANAPINPAMTVTTNSVYVFMTPIGYTGAGDEFYCADGTFKVVSTSAGTTINPTDGFVPYRSNATTFADSPWYRISTNQLGFNGTNFFLQSFLDNESLGNGALVALSAPNGGNFNDWNTAVGQGGVLGIITNGWANTAIGWFAGGNLTNGADNFFGGNEAGENIQDASASVFISALSGGSQVRTDESVYVGWHAGGVLGASIVNGIAIGARATVTNSNEIVIGNLSNTAAIFPIASYTGTGVNFLSDDGTYKAAGGATTNLFYNIVVTNNITVKNGGNIIMETNTYISINGTNVALINPTDNVIPRRTGTNTFGDSSLTDNGVITTTAGNIGALLSVGDTTFVDVQRASQTNEMSGAMTFAHATNGINLVEFTHVRTFYNPSGANRTVTLPALWHNVTGTSFVVTNNTVVELYVKSKGSTATSATQTNVYSNVQYFP